MKRLLLLGGGHSHVEVIRRLGSQPPRDTRVVLVSPDRYTPYSGMLPGFDAGHYDFHDYHIDLERLCETAGVAFRPCCALGIDPRQTTSTAATAARSITTCCRSTLVPHPQRKVSLARWTTRFM